MTTRRKFIQGAALLPAARWRTRSCAKHNQMAHADLCGPALAEHVIAAIEMFNKIAGDRMQIELFFADQLVPTVSCSKPCNAAQLTRCSLMTIPWHPQQTSRFLAGISRLVALFSGCTCAVQPIRLNEIWDEEYSKVGVKHISAGAWDPCHFATKDPITALPT